MIYDYFIDFKMRYKLDQNGYVISESGLLEPKSNISDLNLVDTQNVRIYTAYHLSVRPIVIYF